MRTVGSSGWELTSGRFSNRSRKASSRSLSAKGLRTVCWRAAAIPVKHPTVALKHSQGGAVRRACSSQITAAGRVLGSNSSNRWPDSGSIRAVPARVTAVVAVVTTLNIGALGAIKRGLTGDFPSGYCVHSSWAVPFSAKRIVIPRAVTTALPPPTATIPSASASRAAATPSITEVTGEPVLPPLKTPATRSPKTPLTRSIKSVFSATDWPQTTKTRWALSRSTSSDNLPIASGPAWTRTG